VEFYAIVVSGFVNDGVVGFRRLVESIREYDDRAADDHDAHHVEWLHETLQSDWSLFYQRHIRVT